MNFKTIFQQNGTTIVELLLAIGLSMIILPAILTGLIASREGKSQQKQRVQAITVLKETEEAVRNVREKGWTTFAVNGTYYPAISGSSWTLTSGTQTVNGFTRQVVISDVYRDSSGVISASGSGAIDPSSKKVDITVSWNQPYLSTIGSSLYVTRYLDNLIYTQTTVSDFTADTRTNVQITNTSGGEVMLANNTKAKWCSPAFAASYIDLPDGPPVSVAATASATTSIPNDVFVATAPYATSSVKLAYVNVTANIDPPVSTLRGSFTLDASKYSAPGLVPSGIGIDNTFKTNKVKYYKSSGGKTYALLAIDKPDKEVIAIQINNGTSDAYQDPANKIYTYWTFFNTKQYRGDNRSTPNQDQAPFGYGAVSLAIQGNRGYTISGGYLYVFDLSNIDNKSPSNGLDMIGCRIELDGYDCLPGSGTDRKYSAGQTGTTWSSTTTPVHLDCSDGGNIELYADNDIFPVQVGANTYIYVAVGAGTNPEFEIANVTTAPTSGSALTGNSCGRISGGNSAWHLIGSLDFNSQPNTEEAANSVFGNSAGTRAYVSSNGGVDANGDGIPDSAQFYVIDTSTKNAPKFLSGTPSTGATSGYYNGDLTNIQLFPRRSLTVLNGQRAILVGKDGYPNDSIEPKEYQVLNLDNETSPNYCGGLNFIAGFNDLTSVTEADLDNFVYLVANTNEKQLKIIQGGPDGQYMDTGTIESATFDAGYNTAFNRLSATTTVPASTTLQYQFASANAVSGSCTGVPFNYLGPDGTGGSYYPATGSALFIGNPGTYANPGRCFRYKAFLSTTDFNTTPVLQDVTINYSP